PVYRVEKYISDTVRSVLEQTYQNLEIIIVDDESPDGSLEVCQRIADSRIKIIRQKNRGLAGARNTGIRHATGDYIAFLDGDDLWLPHKIEKHLEHLEKRPVVGISFSKSAFINESGHILGTYQQPKLTKITIPDLLRENVVGNGSSAVLRREVLEDIKYQDNLYGTVEDFYFDEQFRQAEDIECWLRIAIQTKWCLEGLAEPLTLYRVNSGSLSANTVKQLEYAEKLIEKVRKYAPELISKWESLIRAYQLRYLARSAVRRKAGSIAVKMMHQALITDWRIVVEQPRRTLLAWIAAYIVWLLPQVVYYQLEVLTENFKKAMRKRSLLQN
ncbi:MAG: glycosyltransferase family 2 protein, partial [Scytonema sp. PMC 1069.18]|nr:glycosyltransferase family 2 protein [Scytonema sp. PMC 1069.18]